MEKFLVSDTEGYALMKELTGNIGLPNPEYSLNISKYWEIKKDAAMCHQSQMRLMKQFFFIYEKKESHIKAFSKEYYTILTR